MHVQRVAMPAWRAGSWTVLGDDGVPVEPVERFLAYLTDIERSPNTVKAYAHDLKDYWVFLAHRRLDWRGGGAGIGGRCGWRTSASTWRGCGCRLRAGMAWQRCCPRLGPTSVR